MKLNSLSELNSDAEKYGPDLFGKCSPRRIVPPYGYPHPRDQAGLLYAYLCFHDEEHGDDEFKARIRPYALAASGICKHQTPVFFVQDDFIRACLATEPPEGMTLADVKLPMPAFTISLSWEIQREIFGGFWIPFIQVADLPIGKYDLVNGASMENPIHEFVVQGSAFKNDGKHTPVEFSGTAPVTQTIKETLRNNEPVLVWKSDKKDPEKDFVSASQEAETSAKELEYITKEMAKHRIKADAEKLRFLEEKIRKGRAVMVGLDYFLKAHTGVELDKSIVGTMCAVAIKLSLALSVRPELIGSTELIRPEKRKRGVVVKDALWSPIILGRNYRIVYDRPHNSGDDFNKKRMHWRRGHFRNQAYGLRTAPQRKLIWIEPVLINATEV